MPIKVNLAVDLMSGDEGMKVSLASVHETIKQSSDDETKYLLIGNKEEYEKLSENFPKTSAIEFISSETTITMDEEPTKAIRKKNSSMRMAISLVKKGLADGCVSAGNTGALMMLSHLIIKPIDGIFRTAICAGFPTSVGKTWVLDLGANIVTEPNHLFQFATMAKALVKTLENIKNPTFSLLNVGTEHHKGNTLVQKADKLFEKDSQYLGFIEADDIFAEKSNIIVTDGFTGNSLLKACEGLARFLTTETKNEIKKNILNKLLASLALPILLKMKNRFDPSNYNGACFLGFSKTVVKSHGSADIKGFSNAIKIAVNQIKNGLPEKIKESVHQ